jgi:hypothetical protein
MPLLFYLPLIICTGLLAVAQGETRSLVEAHMALICGKVITWFVGCRL